MIAGELRLSHRTDDPDVDQAVSGTGNSSGGLGTRSSLEEVYELRLDCIGLIGEPPEIHAVEGHPPHELVTSSPGCPSRSGVLGG
jgi:hypothetical protein